MTCPQCSTRKPKRVCPGLDNSVICTQCCAAGREGEIACPLTCEYLIAAHQFEHKVADKEKTPSPDIPTDRAFLNRNEYLIVLIGAALLHATHLQPDVDDHDLLAVLLSLVASWRERVPSVMNAPYVADRAVTMIADRVNGEVLAHRQQIAKSGGEAPYDSDILGSLAFLARTCFHMDNGRPKCRAFLGFLRRVNPEKEKKDEPMVVLA